MRKLLATTAIVAGLTMLAVPAKANPPSAIAFTEYCVSANANAAFCEPYPAMQSAK